MKVVSIFPWPGCATAIATKMATWRMPRGLTGQPRRLRHVRSVSRPRVAPGVCDGLAVRRGVWKLGRRGVKPLRAQLPFTNAVHPKAPSATRCFNSNPGDTAGAEGCRAVFAEGLEELVEALLGQEIAPVPDGRPGGSEPLVQAHEVGQGVLVRPPRSSQCVMVSGRPHRDSNSLAKSTVSHRSGRIRMSTFSACSCASRVCSI
jgi:hypothetical protein